MRNIISTVTLFTLCIYYISSNAHATQPNKTGYHVRRSSYEVFKPKRLGTYRSFQPVAVRKPSYIKTDDQNDYEINTYDSEYGAVVSNFTSSIYDDNPPLYPNPESFSGSSQVKGIIESEVELPDDSLADADLKEHNIIDSIYVTSGLAVIFPIVTVLWLMWSESAAEFRRSSKLYPININLCCCLAACTLIYIQAVSGTSSPSQCERIALLLHYTHITCSVWIVALGAAVAEFCTCDTLLPLNSTTHCQWNSMR
ncbi:unnamed protein product [Leptidea sinapis]|uniref:G-protein coupled receptors family 2 profile 2 domain-containing protein n=1 Tax=Leptidea sinapis TaxID=189913 RepID=A0A5E4QBC5_9NEOP|nr:unnamed protein product [Leptidea sinapis]